MQDAIEKLLRNRCIVETVSPPHVVNLLSVSEGKKLRLVLDLRYVNQFLQKQSFRYDYEDLKTLSKVFQQDYYFFTFDLESGYHHVSIRENHQQLLGFSWFFLQMERKFFMFSCPAFWLVDGLLFVYQIIEATGCPMEVDGSRIPSLYR